MPGRRTFERLVHPGSDEMGYRIGPIESMPQVQVKMQLQEQQTATVGSIYASARSQRRPPVETGVEPSIRFPH